MSDTSVPLNQKLALTVTEVGLLTGFSRYFIDQQIAAGRLPAVAPGGNPRSKRILPADVEEWLRRNPYEPAA